MIETVPGDDVLLKDYKPHEHGGPIHLITCSINQTVDDRTGQYNADRLGIALTVSSLGVETGTGSPVPLDQLDLDKDAVTVDEQVGKLSRWVAISGAAASSGMGSQTTPGLAALMFLSGLRLGFWTPKLLPKPKESDDHAQKGKSLTARARAWLATKLPKQSLLTAELLAQFPASTAGRTSRMEAISRIRACMPCRGASP